MNPPAPLEEALPPDPNSAVSAQAWAAVHAYVTGQDRRRALRRELDLGPGNAAQLINLTRAPMSMREIAQSAAVDPSAATVAIDRLERRGLVRREGHPEDKRRKVVHLTDLGRQTAAAAERILTEPPRGFADLDPTDLATLARIFATLNSTAEPAPTGEEF
ncbi:MarR family winged helix-turn-helix transcriptional regulator [Streptomyces sp. NPDC059262]|uniref:MarR family winged helix-turn-helix transcriptional regulator n=1 Tax=Streptomyces sp. NPDC059262 TaxID=3346797 RepID=UPI00367430B7